MTRELADKQILITGGAGFIGSHLAERLCQNNRLRLLDNYRRDSLSGLPLERHPNVELVRADVLDPEALRRAVEGFPIVLHLAAIAGVSSYYEQPLRTLEVNLLGTVRLLEAAVAAGVERLLYLSSSEIYGPQALDVGEDDPCSIGPPSERRWVYACSKLASENFVLRNGEEHAFATTCLRPFNVYGPRQTGEGAISNFCRAAVGGQPLQVYGDGSAIRAWCHIDDMVRAVELALTHPRAAGECFNIGNPAEVETTLGLARRVAALVPGSRIEQLEVERSEVVARTPRVDKARELLGWEPRVGLEQGLEGTLAWFRERSTA